MERGEGRFRQKELKSATIDPNRDAFLIPGVTVPEESGAKRGLRYAGRALVAVFALIGVLTVVVGSVNAIREPMLQYLVKHFGEYSSVTFPESEYVGTKFSEIEMEVDPLAGLLPEGYILSQTIQLGDYGTQWVYANNYSNLVIYTIQPETGVIRMDTEDAEKYYEFQINGYNAFYTQKDSFRIIWIDSVAQRVHNLSADCLGYEQLLEIASILSQSN